MLTKRSFLIATAALAATPAFAASPLPFTAAAFAAAQKAGKSIIVHVHADWCPTCQAQKPTLSKLESTPDFKNVVFFQVNFDDQKDVVHQLGVRGQSTLILYKGGKEIDRSIGLTSPDALERLLRQVI